jgi:hypothetical protein
MRRGLGRIERGLRRRLGRGDLDAGFLQQLAALAGFEQEHLLARGDAAAELRVRLVHRPERDLARLDVLAVADEDVVVVARRVDRRQRDRQRLVHAVDEELDSSTLMPGFSRRRVSSVTSTGSPSSR